MWKKVGDRTSENSKSQQINSAVIQDIKSVQKKTYVLDMGTFRTPFLLLPFFLSPQFSQFLPILKGRLSAPRLNLLCTPLVGWFPSVPEDHWCLSFSVWPSRCLLIPMTSDFSGTSLSTSPIVIAFPHPIDLLAPSSDIAFKIALLLWVLLSPMFHRSPTPSYNIRHQFYSIFHPRTPKWALYQPCKFPYYRDNFQRSTG